MEKGPELGCQSITRKLSPTGVVRQNFAGWTLEDLLPAFLIVNCKIPTLRQLLS
jgi:hypothetical protein